MFHLERTTTKAPAYWGRYSDGSGAVGDGRSWLLKKTRVNSEWFGSEGSNFVENVTRSLRMAVQEIEKREVARRSLFLAEIFPYLAVTVEQGRCVVHSLHRRLFRLQALFQQAFGKVETRCLSKGRIQRKVSSLNSNSRIAAGCCVMGFSISIIDC